MLRDDIVVISRKLASWSPLRDVHVGFAACPAGVGNHPVGSRGYYASRPPGVRTLYGDDLGFSRDGEFRGDCPVIIVAGVTLGDTFGSV